MVRRYAALSGAVVLSSVLLAAAPAAPAVAQDIVVSQGDEIYVQKGTSPDGQLLVSSCRIGFMQPDGRGLTAAHCGPPGAAVFDPNNPGVQLGTLAVPESYQITDLPEGGQWASNDYGYIDFLPGVVSGGNPITGDQRADTALLNIGDEVCLSAQDGPVCGPMMGIREEQLFFSAQAREGDSGGPVYSPQLGFLGVMSVGGIKAMDPVTDEEMSVLIAAMGENGTSVTTPEQATTLLMNYLKHKHGENYTFSAPGVDPETGEGAGASDAPRPVEISFAPAEPREPNDGTDGGASGEDQNSALGQPRSVVNPILAGVFGLLLVAMVAGAVMVKKRSRPESDAHAMVEDYEEPDSTVS